MLGLKMTKKGWGGDNVRSRSKSRERVSLLGNGRSHSKDGLRGRENRRRTRGEQEMVSLLGKPSPGKLKKSDLGRRRKKYSNFNPRSFNIRWTKWTYLGLLLLTAFVTNKVIKKGKKVLHWEDFDSLLEPQAPQEERCFEETIEIISHVTGKTRKFPCSCPTPNVALANTNDPLWKSNHERMVSEAKNHAGKDDLDIVFFGDGVVEQLSGSRDLGKTMIDGMENHFDKTYKKGYGGKFNAIALGSTGDTGPNLLWHWENGIQQANLRPKLWYLVVGSNELYVHKCNDDFVKASVLNVAKRIFEDQPDAKIVVHGIFPRKDDLDSKTNNLGSLWNRAQGVNLDVRKFIKKHSSRVQYMNLGQTLMGNGLKGRKAINPSLIDGLFPTAKGMVKWSDLLVKKVKPILKGFDREAHRKQTKKPDGDAGKP